MITIDLDEIKEMVADKYGVPLEEVQNAAQMQTGINGACLVIYEDGE